MMTPLYESLPLGAVLGPARRLSSVAMYKMLFRFHIHAILYAR